MKKITFRNYPESTYVECARKIASGNICAGLFHMVQTVLAKTATFVVMASGKTEGNGTCLESEYPFGEVISLVGVAGESAVVTVRGKDYLGQDMAESITLSGATAVSGKKAFKKIVSFKASTATTGAVTLGLTNKIGIPFKSCAVLASATDGVVDATVVTLTAPAATQSLTSADPRGILDLSAKTAGAEMDAVLFTSEFCSKTSGEDTNGGLFGFKHVIA